MPNSVEMTLNLTLRTDRLRETREQRGWSQRQLARLCGLGDLQIHRYESGATEPSATILGTIAYHLGVSLDYLVGLTDVPNNPAYESLRTDETKLLEAYAIGDSSTLIELMSERLKLLANQKKTE